MSIVNYDNPYLFVEVLILIILEVTLWVLSGIIINLIIQRVLILIILEVTLWGEVITV